jgi:hypothetical protein
MTVKKNDKRRKRGKARRGERFITKNEGWEEVEQD